MKFTRHPKLISGPLMRCFTLGVLAIGISSVRSAAQMPRELDLRTALTYAVDHNFAIRQARERIREQDGLVVEVKGAVLPNLALNGFYSVEDEALANAFTPDQNWQLSLQVTQLIYSGGGVRAALDVQDLVKESALLELETIINDQLLRARTNFYNVLLAREQIEVQEQNVGLFEEQLQTTKNRFEAGTVSNFEVLRAEVELANAQPALIRARNNHRVAIDELRYSLGYEETNTVDVNRTPEIVGELEFTPVEYELETALQSARLNRPELKQLETIRKAREAGLVIAKSNRRPTVSVNGGLALRKDFGNSSFQGSRTGWTLGAAASWSIWDGASTNGRISQALSQQEQARLALLDTSLAVEVEVRRALADLDGASELAAAATKVVDQAEEALRLANARYGAGTATQLDVLSAQVSLTSARNNLVEANYSYIVASASVRRAMGLSDVMISR
ncbi:TolC family protein [Opitutaceae bacterium]|nr:TolC family protein [Opitutaceae bacterium]MDB4473603.1 TolC family protein [Opitutaceae bacterium]